MKSYKLKTVALLTSSGVVFQTAGNCLPENYWAILLGDTINAGVVGAIGGIIAAGIEGVLGA